MPRGERQAGDGEREGEKSQVDSSGACADLNVKESVCKNKNACCMCVRRQKRRVGECVCAITTRYTNLQ